jgi:GT2 family glycosyltransferase
MQEALKNEHAGLLSPTIYDSVTKKLWFGKGKIEYTRMRAVHVKPSHGELSSGAFESEFLTGCALLMSRPLVEAIGYLDERFFLYYEDADFSLRAKEAGFSLVVVPEAKVWHAEQSNQSESKLYHLVLSGLLFFEKHGKGLWKPYFFVYGTIRRIKNRSDLLFGRKEAPLVRLAYNNFSHEHSSSHFPRVRQLP